MAEAKQAINITVRLNGQTVNKNVEPRESLADFIRHRVGLTGTHVGCEQGICGACTIRLNGRTARACLTLAVQADGQTVETIEGLTDSGEIEKLQQAFHINNAAQCGFCTPGMLMSANELLSNVENPGREQIREYLSGNYCRCTGYQAIIDAVEQASRDQGNE